MTVACHREMSHDGDGAISDDDSLSIRRARHLRAGRAMNRKAKKLNLSRNVIRALAEPSLRTVAGGEAATFWGWCWTEGASCGGGCSGGTDCSIAPKFC